MIRVHVTRRQLRSERVGLELDLGHERDGDNAGKVHRPRQDRIDEAHAEPLADHSADRARERGFQNDDSMIPSFHSHFHVTRISSLARSLLAN